MTAETGRTGVLEPRRRHPEAFDGGQDADRRGDERVAVEQRQADDAQPEQQRVRAGRSAYSRRASAASAITPPSPSLSARMTTPTYFTETISVIDQNIRETTP